MKYPDSKYLERLGKIAISFSDIEHSLRILLEVIIDPKSKLGTIFATHLSFPRLLDSISASYMHKWSDCPKLDELNKLLGMAQELEKKRNTLFHSDYGFPDDTPEALLVRSKSTAKRKHGLRHVREEISTSKLDSYITELIDLNTDIISFFFDTLENKYRTKQ